jgi:hypothetical protein
LGFIIALHLARAPPHLSVDFRISNFAVCTHPAAALPALPSGQVKLRFTLGVRDVVTRSDSQKSEAAAQKKEQGQTIRAGYRPQATLANAPVCLY